MALNHECTCSKFNTDTVWNFTRQLKWLDKYLFGHKGFIAGGFAKQIFNEQRVRDLDIFFESREDFDAAVEWYGGTNAYGRLGPTSKEGDRIDEYYENDNVHAFEHTYKEKRVMIIELNKKIFGPPISIIEQFDFTIAKFAYALQQIQNTPGPDGNPWVDENGFSYHYEGLAIYHPKYFEHLTLKRLVIDEAIPYPTSTYERMFKYAKYGYFPCRETKIKMIKALREMPEEDVTKLANYYTDGID